MGLDLSNANEIGGNDPEFIKELMEVYVKRYPEYHDTLEEAIKQGDLHEMASRVHRLKSACSVLGYKDYSKELIDTENYCLSPEANHAKATAMCKDMLAKFELSLNEVKDALNKL